MKKSSTPASPKSTALGRSLLVGVGKGLLLLVGGGLATAFGVAIAHVYPATPVADPAQVPFLEHLLQRSLARTRRMPPQISQPAASATPVSNTSAPPESLFQGTALKATLPSDILFKDSQSALRPETQVILDNIITDLRNYRGATIRLTAHTDNLGDPATNRELSLRQTHAIRQYLTRHLEGQFRWVLVGYGSSQPLVANDTDTNRQRNRRIEITIEP